MALCSCGKSEVQIQKWGLCRRCYQRQIREKKDNSIILDAKFQPIIQNASERQFALTYFRHDKWVQQPATFSLRVATYTPDFWDGAAGVFIEVVGTRAAFYANKQKYEMFHALYPSLPLRFHARNGLEVCKFDENGMLSSLDTKTVEENE